MRKKHPTRVFIVGTVYTLLFYLLMSSEEEVKDTFFFYGDGVKPDMMKGFPHQYFIKTTPSLNSRRWVRIKVRLLGLLRWKFLRTAEIFGHDHLTFSSGLIGKRPYTLMEDGPHALPCYYKMRAYSRNLEKRKGIKGKIAEFIAGPLCFRPQGDNNQCKKLILSVSDNSPLEKGKNITVMCPEKLWSEASDKKKSFILSVFNITPDDTILKRGKSIVFFTQIFATDGFLTEAEQIALYRPILQKYNPEEVLIKAHPRDIIQYEKYFPDIAVFSKPVPMQLLDIMGIRFKKAVTISSSAVLSIPYPIEIEWVGNSCHPKLLAALGEWEMPEKQQ
jgi:hypothetical protein